MCKLIGILFHMHFQILARFTLDRIKKGYSSVNILLLVSLWLFVVHENIPFDQDLLFFNKLFVPSKQNNLATIKKYNFIFIFCSFFEIYSSSDL